MVLMNRFNARAVATFGAGKYNDGAVLLLHKRASVHYWGKTHKLKKINSPCCGVWNAIFIVAKT